jgi:hypothetical protein
MKKALLDVFKQAKKDGISSENEFHVIAYCNDVFAGQIFVRTEYQPDKVYETNFIADYIASSGMPMTAKVRRKRLAEFKRDLREGIKALRKRGYRINFSYGKYFG